MRDDPSLLGRPIAVGGNSDSRGVISTCNYEALQFGVRSAMPAAQARMRRPDLLILPHRMDAYREASTQMRRIFYDYTELVEPLSLDEAYLDVSDSVHFFGSATRIAEIIRQRVRGELQLTVSAGVAPNKFLAKIASDWKKPDGLFVITPAEVDQFVQNLPVNKIFGVGKATTTRLSEQNINTCLDVRAYSVFELQQRFGQLGVCLFELSRGIDTREVIPSRRRKSLSVENTYPKALPDLASCLQRLPELLMQLAGRLCRIDEDYLVVKIFVKIKFADFTTTTIERTETELVPELFARLCTEAHARKNLPVRLLGVGVRFVDLRDDREFSQLDLFR